MPFTIVRGDIAKMKTDAVVDAAGAEKITEASENAVAVRVGKDAVTSGSDFPAKYIIHAAGPVYDPENSDESWALLRSAYLESMKLAQDYRCRSIALPLRSGELHGFPKEKALHIAVSAVRDFLETADMDIYLAVPALDSFAVNGELLEKIESYIEENYIKSRWQRQRIPDAAADERMYSAGASCMEEENSAPLPMKTGLDDLVGHLDEPFNVMLLRLIDAKGMTDAEVYKKANIDRKLFSKIRRGGDYMPGKRTALALAVALELNLEETDDLLERAGYVLSHSKKFDVIVEYFIVNGKYDIFEINEVLFRYDQPLLGAGL